MPGDLLDREALLRGEGPHDLPAMLAEVTVSIGHVDERVVGHA